MTFKGEKWNWETDLWNQAETEQNIYVSHRNSSLSIGKAAKKSTGLYMEFLDEIEHKSTSIQTTEPTKNMSISDTIGVKSVRGRPFYKAKSQAQPGGNIKSDIQMQLRANGPAISNECIERMVRNQFKKESLSNTEFMEDACFPDLSFQRSQD